MSEHPVSHDAHPDEAAHQAAHVAAHIKTYLAVGAILLFGTFITVLLSYVDLGSQGRNIFVAMVVATVKVGFVAMIFMHLNSEKKSIYRVVVITVFCCTVLFALTWLAIFDPIHL